MCMHYVCDVMYVFFPVLVVVLLVFLWWKVLLHSFCAPSHISHNRDVLLVFIFYVFTLQGFCRLQLRSAFFPLLLLSGLMVFACDSPVLCMCFAGGWENFGPISSFIVTSIRFLDLQILFLFSLAVAPIYW